MKSTRVEDGLGLDGFLGGMAKEMERIARMSSVEHEQFVQKTVKSVPVDLVKILNSLKDLQEAGVVKEEDEIKEYCRNSFYKAWIELTPPIFSSLLKEAIKRKESGALEFLESILKMGDKLYVISRKDAIICVDISLSVKPCKECYFFAVCEIAKKNK